MTDHPKSYSSLKERVQELDQVLQHLVAEWLSEAYNHTLPGSTRNIDHVGDLLFSALNYVAAKTNSYTGPDMVSELGRQLSRAGAKLTFDPDRVTNRPPTKWHPSLRGAMINGLHPYEDPAQCGARHPLVYGGMFCFLVAGHEVPKHCDPMGRMWTDAEAAEALRQQEEER